MQQGFRLLFEWVFGVPQVLRLCQPAVLWSELCVRAASCLQLGRGMPFGKCSLETVPLSTCIRYSCELVQQCRDGKPAFHPLTLVFICMGRMLEVYNAGENS